MNNGEIVYHELIQFNVIFFSVKKLIEAFIETAHAVIDSFDCELEQQTMNDTSVRRIYTLFRLAGSFRISTSCRETIVRHLHLLNQQWQLSQTTLCITWLIFYIVTHYFQSFDIDAVINCLRNICFVCLKKITVEIMHIVCFSCRSQVLSLQWKILNFSKKYSDS